MEEKNTLIDVQDVHKYYSGRDWRLNSLTLSTPEGVESSGLGLEGILHRGQYAASHSDTVEVKTLLRALPLRAGSTWGCLWGGHLQAVPPPDCVCQFLSPTFELIRVDNSLWRAYELRAGPVLGGDEATVKALEAGADGQTGCILLRAPGCPVGAGEGSWMPSGGGEGLQEGAQ